MGGIEDFSEAGTDYPKDGRLGALEAVAAGALAFESTRILVYEDIAIYPDGSATMYRSNFLDAQAHSTVRELRFKGVFRRPSGFLLPKIVECDLEDIQKHDRLILTRDKAEPLCPKVHKQRDMDYYNKEIYDRWL